MEKGKWIQGEVENEYSYINFVIQLSRESVHLHYHLISFLPCLFHSTWYSDRPHMGMA